MMPKHPSRAHVGKALIALAEPLQRAMFYQALQEAGFDVVQCSNGTDALSVLEHHVFHAVVLDSRMPGATALEVMQRLRERDAEVPVIVLSGVDASPPEQVEVAFTGTLVQRKPISGSDLVREVLAVLSKVPRTPGGERR